MEKEYDVKSFEKDKKLKQVKQLKDFFEELMNNNVDDDKIIRTKTSPIKKEDSQDGPYSFYFRDSYKKMKDLFTFKGYDNNNRKIRFYIIKGNPGIGKSIFIYYLMIKYGKKKNFLFI